MENDIKSVWNKHWAKGISEELSYEERRRLKILQNWVGDFKGKKWLEIGAGSGRTALYLAKCGASVTVYEISKVSIGLIRKNAERNGVRIEIIESDITKPINRDIGRYDVVYSAGVIEHFADTDIAVQNMSKLIAQNGLLICFAPQTYSYWTIIKKRKMKEGSWFGGWETNFSAWELRRLFSVDKTLRFKHWGGFNLLFLPYNFYNSRFRKFYVWTDRIPLLNLFGKEIGVCFQKTKN